jgi:hypothetical protein
MLNCAYAKGANCKGAQNCAKVVLLSYNQIDIFPLNFLKFRRCCLFVHSTCEFNDEIMKIGYLNKKFHTRNLKYDQLVSRKARKVNFQSLK